MAKIPNFSCRADGEKVEDKSPKIEDKNTKIEDKNPKIEDKNSKIEDKNPQIVDKNPKIEDKNPIFSSKLFPNMSKQQTFLEDPFSKSAKIFTPAMRGHAIFSFFFT